MVRKAVTDYLQLPEAPLRNIFANRRSQQIRLIKDCIGNQLNLERDELDAKI
ncbi:MAG: hypothetical protein ACR2PH_04365 [Desulfobulbia bacterium]